jgi:4-amino-4-deoxy-L-arabinose transferase-like glycosyltransferase
VRTRLPLAAILLIAAVARFWAIDFCLPSVLCRPDEEAVAAITTQFFARDLNPHFFDWPPLFMYAVTLALIPYAKYLKFTGALRSEYRFLQSISSDPTPILLVARVLSALAGTISVGVLYKIGETIGGRLTGLVAALFLALSYLHVRDSHFGVTDVTATLLALIVVSIAARMNIVTTRQVVIAGAITGLAAATKYNAAAAALPVCWMIATDRTSSWRVRSARALTLASVAAAAFVIVAPYSVIELSAFTRSLNGISAHLAGGHGPDVGRGWWVHLSSTLRFGVGLPLLACGVIGLAWQCVRSPRVGIAIAIFPLASYVAIGGGLTVFSRYAIPLVPFVCLGAAISVVAGARAVAERVARPQWAPAIAWLAAIVVVLPSARSAWQFDRLLAVEDSRVAAASWITMHYPDGAVIGETERRFNRLSFHDGDATHPSRYQTRVLTVEEMDPDVIAVAESPLHPDGLPPAVTGERLSRYQKVFESSAPERPGSIYDWQDEFYIPLAGIDHLDRPGPRITLYARERGR